MMMGHYFASVGRNAALLLNLPPDKRGLIHEIDTDSVIRFKQLRDEVFSKGIINQKGMPDTFTRSKNEDKEFILDFGEPIKVNCIELMEDVNEGQQVEEFEVYGQTGKGEEKILSSTTIGYKRLLAFPEIEITKIRLAILKTRGDVYIRKIELYDIEKKYLEYVD